MVGPHEEILILSALEQEANKQKKKKATGYLNLKPDKLIYMTRMLGVKTLGFDTK